MNEADQKKLHQFVDTSVLMGADWCIPRDRSVVEQEIGRRTIFGNPFRPAAGEELRGKTLEPYRKYLFAAIMGEKWAIEQYKEATGIDLPKDFAQKVKDLVDLPFWCPGCRNRSEEEGVCHGSVLRKASVWLNTPDGAKHVH